MAAEFTEDTFKSDVLGSDTPVLVDFYSDSWGPCKRLGPVIEELTADNDGVAKIGKVNVGDHMSLAVEYGIAAVPTILIFKGGEVVERMQGYKDKGELQTAINEHTSA